MAKSKPPLTDTHPAEQYAYDILDGKIPANRWVRLACERFIRDIKDQKAKGIYLDVESGDRAVRFFPTFLRFYEGAFDGKPFILQPWQIFIIYNLFAWKGDDGFRRFRTAYIEAAKGCGKSPLAAGIGLYGLTMDNEPGSEVYSCAVTREQAGILFRDAKAFVEGSPSLQRRLVVDKHNIAYPDTNSFFRPLSSEHRGLDGKRPHIALIDEIHEHPTGVVVDKMRAGTKSRREAMIVELTNAGYDRNSICYQHHDYSEKVLQQIIDNESWFTFMTGLDVCPTCADHGATIPTDGCPDCDDWRDEKVWAKANPSLNVTITDKYLREQVNEAINLPAKQNIVKRLNFCIWSESSVKWLSTDQWNACNGRVNVEELRDAYCFGGLDLSSNTDVTALVWVFPPSSDDYYRVVCRFFIPEDNMRERVKRDRVPYDVWVRDGYIVATPGNIIDYDYILKQIESDCALFNVQELAFDRWGSQKITTDLQKLGFEIQSANSSAYAPSHTLVQFGQGFASMNSPAKELEKIVAARQLAHGGNPVLAWMASNVVVQSDAAGNIKPAKDKSTERIDGIVALLMALDRAVRGDEGRSVYEDEGVTLV
jgi:phage terminase large subunit-like protein